jgi:cyanophycin synthetase
LNIFDEHPFKVILDYAHNPAAIKTIASLASRLEVKGKRRIVMAMPGDRRDEDIIDAANIVASTFDSFVCKADDDRRGRGHDEVPMLLKKTLEAKGVSADKIEVIPSEKDAVEAGLASCAPGDLLIILGDNITRCWKQIVHFNSANAKGLDDADSSPSIDYPEKLFEPIEHKFELEQGTRIVHDERGVHIVVERDEESD